MELIQQISNLLEYIFWFIIVFSIIVFVHEYGHYYVAKINNVAIEKFSIGFGPPIISFKGKNDMIWQISAIPLGGYVKFSGEMYPDNQSKKEKENKRLFFNKNALQKASIVVAGPIANFILGILIFIFIFFVYGKNTSYPIIGMIDKNSPASLVDLKVNDKILAINNIPIKSYTEVYDILEGEYLESISVEVLRNNKTLFIKLEPKHKTVKTFIGSKKQINYLGIHPMYEPIVGKVFEDSPAYKAGLVKNDKILEINNIEIFDIRQVIDIIGNNPEKEISIKLLRNKIVIDKIIVPEAFQEGDQIKGKIGIGFKNNKEKISFSKSILESFENFYLVVIKTIKALTEIIFGKRDHCEVGGPILIAKVSNDFAKTDIFSFLSLIALISINLGIINLFPLPLLDGGHLITYICEFISGKKLTYNFFKYIQIFGGGLLISLMIFSIVNDIYCRILN